MTKALQIVNDKTGAIAVNGKFAITPVGLRVLSNPSFDDWCEFGRGLQKLECATQWTVGDWLNYGERKWGEKYAQAIEETGVGYQAIANYKWVAGQIEFSTRVENLSWAHHREVASDNYTNKQRGELLAFAKYNKLSVAQFKKYLLVQRRLARIVENSPTNTETYRLIHSDIADGMAQIESDSIDVIITDPPYPEEYLSLYETMAREAQRVLKGNSLLVAMCGQIYLPDIFSMMARHLDYHWIAAYLTPGGQATQIFPRKAIQFWKPIVIFRKGESYRGEWFGDVCQSAVNDNDKSLHDWGQSISGMLDIVKRFSIEGDLVLDPFTGASTTGAACLQLKRRFIGIDSDEAAIATSATRLSEICQK